MKILVTGSNGLVGSHFIDNFSNSNNILSPAKNELDIVNPQSVENYFRLHKPDAVVHFAAFTDVSMAEDQRSDKNGACWTINVEGTNNLIRASFYQPYFIYISTDTVFSGSKDNPGPYEESYPPEENPNKVSWYGWTKREGEKLVSTNLKNVAILRIANPVRTKYKDKLDYVRKILKQYDTGKLYPMFDNQYLTLTYINEVTEALKILLERRLTGIFHVSSTNLFTPYKLANLLIEKARGKKGFVKSISIKSFLKNNFSRYPQYGGLKVEKTQKTLNLNFRPWEEVIEILSKQFSI